MDTVSPGSFTDRMLRRASTSRVSFRQNTLLKSMDNKRNSMNENNDRLTDVSVVSSLTAAINDIENDIDALGTPHDLGKQSIVDNKTPTRKQSKYKRITSTGTPDSFNEKRIRRTSSRVSNSKRTLFDKSDSDNEVDENNDYQLNDSLMPSLSAALKDLDNECDALGIFPADDLKKPLGEIYQQNDQLTYKHSIDDKNKLQGIENITNTKDMSTSQTWKLPENH
ncbi:uncharacterized protein LOC122860367 isoform X2 [Aphidius gifuensis]|uniref:uncharacterized protein LOC122860367 isoform X2 n=1 Tax=Aphidius gifuensis TaxID=684658 RepID=UPI001CDBCE60|nr:uncharacterized protein LOC122860367 isoform X2 [Aphidius gifuensis]